MESRICPICKKTYTDYPALSRRDNKTEICPECGMREALGQYLKYNSQSINEGDSQ